MMGWNQNGWSWGAGAFGMVMMIVFWGGLIALAIWGISRATRSQQSSPQDSPRAILDRRFASGEIDAESYAQARRTLEGSV